MFENTFLGSKRGFQEARRLGSSTTDPGDAGRGASLYRAGFKVWQQLGNKESVRAIIDLDDSIVPARTAFELEKTDTRVQNKNVDDGDFITELLGELLDTLVSVDVEFHDFYRGIGILILDARITT
jgi:hypothetical protein